ncbi:MAG TPA: L-threonine 3-dehydrogenase [Anaerolineae bacterium]|nr:L-threonine 3-dehydrogenase [Anaerolineae bacterium]
MTDTMQAVVKPAREPGLTLTTKEVPAIGPRDVLIKVRATSICGTDLHIYNWDAWAQGRIKHIPLIQGHELCGEVVEVGSEVARLKPGDFISAESHIVDYEGEYYKRGLGHVAPETQIIGVDRDGSFADYIALPWQNARKNPKDMPLHIAVLKENFGNAIHTGFAAELEGKDVLITGCGPVGLMTMLIAHARGARTIVASDVSEYRIQFARQLGADHIVNAKTEDLVEKVRDITHGAGVDVLLEMSGAPSAIVQGLSLIKYAGVAVVFGLPAKPFEFDLSNLVIFKGITVHGIIGRKMWKTWEQMEDLLSRGKVDLSPLVTHTFKLEEFDQAFAAMASGNSGKVMMTP